VARSLNNLADLYERQRAKLRSSNSSRLVVLSACNTVAGDKAGAEDLSGLARWFLYAGARALLVPHWAVDSDGATRLTTLTFDGLEIDPKDRSG
jgi:CHAT domain-containing protein